ncbi:MAG: hypothetical protein EPO07_10765 [Verrucomicrobia bacterium]|nr:MAG: hypothetical protein EPO07_10765 [Verrucomicrobiota bacterium]
MKTPAPKPVRQTAPTRCGRVVRPWLCAALSAAILGVASSTHAEVEDKITKSYAVAPGGQLVLEADRGSIEIKTAEANVVNIEVTRKAGGSRGKAENTLKDHVVTTTQDGNKVEVRAKYGGEKSSGWFGNSPELQVNFTITVPRKFDVDLKTAGGHIQVIELTGKVDARTSGGHLEFQKIEGPISGQTSGGHITVAGCKGKVELGTSGGHLDLGKIEGDVTAKTSGGSIQAKAIIGKTVLKTSGGHIEVAGIRGSIEAGTSGGSISAELLDQPAGDCSFKTSGGHITVTLGAKAAVDVDLRTSAGRVSTDFPVATTVQGEQDKSKLAGKVNGGGPLITAHTSAGNVRLEKK